jgi:integrase
MSSAWRRAMAAALKAGVISKEERFGLHGLKHRGITDTKGTKADKQLASGHRSMQMVHLYDHERPVVDPAGKA